MNDKVLIITIFSLLGIGFIAILFVAVPWFTNYLLPNWKDTLIDSGIVVVAIILFVYGFYMNTRMHQKFSAIMDEKKLIIILACLLIIGFLSLFIIIIPWASWERVPDWKSVAIDNLLMAIVFGAIVYGIYMGSKTMQCFFFSYLKPSQDENSAEN